MKFVEDVPDARIYIDWDHVAAELRAHPGDWALIMEGVNVSIPNGIRKGNKRIPLNEFEMRTANNTHGTNRTCDLYLRYKKPALSERAREKKS